MQIRSERLILRPPLVEDAPIYFEAERETSVTSGMDWHAQGSESAWRSELQRRAEPLAGAVAHHFTIAHAADVRAADARAAEETSTGTPIGAVALKPDPFEQSPGVWNVGYWILPRWHGCGFATEAVDALVRWAFTELQATRLIAGVAVDNIASHQVLKKNDFSPFEERQFCTQSLKLPNIRYHRLPPGREADAPHNTP